MHRRSDLEIAIRWTVAIMLLFVGTGISVHIWEWLYPLLMEASK